VYGPYSQSITIICDIAAVVNTMEDRCIIGSRPGMCTVKLKYSYFPVNRLNLERGGKLVNL
jgi:hypothetical protein